MKTSSPFDACVSICDEHEHLVLLYHQALVIFRQGIYDSLEPEKIWILKSQMDSTKKDLNEHVLRRTQRLIDLAYKKTARIDYQRNPKDSPVSQAQDNSQPKKLDQAKSALVKRFESLRGSDLSLDLEQTDWYTHIYMVNGDDRMMSFTFAKLKVQEVMYLLMICQWTLDAKIVKEAGGKKDNPHTFTLPLSFQVATEEKARELCEWVLISLGERHFQVFFPDQSARISEAVEALRELKVVPDNLLTRDYPEVYHVVENAKKSPPERK